MGDLNMKKHSFTEKLGFEGAISSDIAEELKEWEI